MSDRLSVIDESYLRIEGPDVPLHVASVGIFEEDGLVDASGAFRLDAIRARIEGRLGLLPRLRQRYVDVPFGLARPVWVDDDHFDIAHHVDTVELGAPHDEAALLALVEDLIMEPLDRDRPLWHLRFVTGLAGGRVALVERAHHAMIDGVSGVDVSLVILDAEREVADDASAVWSPEAPPTPAALLAQGLVDRVRAPARAAAGAVRALRDPAHLARRVVDTGAALAAMRDGGLRAPSCSINAPVGPRRRLVLVRERLADVRAAGTALDATVNDVVLAAVASGLRELFLARGERLPTDRTVKVLIPVSVRSDGESMALGNRVGGLVGTLPVGIGDPIECLHAIVAMTRALKGSGEATTMDLALQAADLLPPTLAHLVQQGIDHQPFVNLVVTNVPGPPFPLYAMGARMLEAFPVVPLGARMTLEVAVLSYDGALNLCITADRDACPDVDRFALGVRAGFEVLHAAWTPLLDPAPAAR